MRKLAKSRAILKFPNWYLIFNDPPMKADKISLSSILIKLYCDDGFHTFHIHRLSSAANDLSNYMANKMRRLHGVARFLSHTLACAPALITKIFFSIQQRNLSRSTLNLAFCTQMLTYRNCAVVSHKICNVTEQILCHLYCAFNLNCYILGNQ